MRKLTKEEYSALGVPPAWAVHRTDSGMWWVRCHLDHAQITWWAAVRNRTNDFVERALDAVCIVRPAPRGKYYIIPGNISIDADLLDRMEKDYGPGFTTLNAAKTAYMLLHGPC